MRVRLQAITVNGILNMVFRFSLPLCCALFTGFVFAAPVDSNLADRYLDLSLCMERTMGKGWQHRYDIHMLTNRWGALEPSESDLDSAPQAVRVTALRCRRETSLTARQLSSFGR